MSILTELLKPMTPEGFRKDYFLKNPYAAAGKAQRFYKLISWPLLSEIFSSSYNDCWLPKEGRLPKDPKLSTGRLTVEQALREFEEGRSALVRHSERAHPALKEIADDFHELFGDPIDIQLYATPPGEELRCHLKPGGWLYIPAGVWHKARANTPSFHLSVGVMSSERGDRR